MNLSLKCPVNYLMPKPYITSLKGLFVPEGGELPKLVESNKPTRPSHSDETSIPRQ